MQRKLSAGLLFGFLLLVQPVFAVQIPDINNPELEEDPSERFAEFLNGICQRSGTPPDLLITCSILTGPVTGDPLGGVAGIAGLGGSAGAYSGTLSNSVQDRLQEVKGDMRPDGGGSSADGDSGWGFLVTPLLGKAERKQTLLENGYKSDLNGYLLGVDYRFNNSFVLGLTRASMEDDADFAGNLGSLRATSSAQVVYGTWLVTDAWSVDFYIGDTDAEYDSERNIDITAVGGISGTVRGSTDSSQDIYGASVNYDWYLGPASIGAFLNLDSIKIETDGYREQGDTGLEIIYPDQESESYTMTYGLHTGYSKDFSWGMLSPRFRIAAVREQENDARLIHIELRDAPGNFFTVATDEPDRNYLLAGLGLVALLDGTQIFLDYEQRSGHDFIDSWALSFGVLVGF
jgi:uncharacterized protein YhjY with autotransporter beta-barrel domain